jgi:hypothetical protein
LASQIFFDDVNENIQHSLANNSGQPLLVLAKRLGILIAVYKVVRYSAKDKEGKIWTCRKTTRFHDRNMSSSSTPECIYDFGPGLSRGRFRTDGWTMAARASVTWTHCSVLFEVIWGKTVRVRTDIGPSARMSSPPSPLPPSPTPSPADAVCCARGREKKIKIKIIFFNFFFGSLLLVFGFQSPKSPKSPNSPSSAGFAGEAARRRRFFRPSSSSHPSKLYSSLGWLNSKVPKPFPPFSLRLIDVDGF